jgi:hypothetical protein
VIDLALKQFKALRDRPLRKQPATGEMLVWLQMLALAGGGQIDPASLNKDLSELPYAGLLLKDHSDVEEVLRGAKRS